jgi:hypothetical protein
MTMVELERILAKGRRQSSLFAAAAPRTASYREDRLFEGMGATRVHSLVAPRQIRLVVCPQQCGAVSTPVLPRSGYDALSLVLLLG